MSVLTPVLPLHRLPQLIISIKRGNEINWRADMFKLSTGNNIYRIACVFLASRTNYSARMNTGVRRHCNGASRPARNMAAMCRALLVVATDIIGVMKINFPRLCEGILRCCHFES